MREQSTALVSQTVHTLIKVNNDFAWPDLNAVKATLKLLHKIYVK